jgi:hypothetical protein
VTVGKSEGLTWPSAKDAERAHACNAARSMGSGYDGAARDSSHRPTTPRSPADAALPIALPQHEIHERAAVQIRECAVIRHGNR